MTIVVRSDTSPIRALHFLAQVALLDRLFGSELSLFPSRSDELARPRSRFSPIDGVSVP